MEETLQKMRIVTKEHMDAIEQDLWGTASGPKDRSAEGPSASHSADRRVADPEADPEKEYPVEASIACLPHISLATRKDYRVYRSDEGKRVTLDTGGTIRIVTLEATSSKEDRREKVQDLDPTTSTT